ncbi:hypothetical protein [Methanocalculus sp. MC3]
MAFVVMDNCESHGFRYRPSIQMKACVLPRVQPTSRIQRFRHSFHSVRLHTSQSITIASIDHYPDSQMVAPGHATFNTSHYILCRAGMYIPLLLLIFSYKMSDMLEIQALSGINGNA